MGGVINGSGLNVGGANVVGVAHKQIKLLEVDLGKGRKVFKWQGLL